MDIILGIMIFGAGFFISGVLVSSGASVKINDARRQGWIEGVSDLQAIEMLHRHLHSQEQSEPEKPSQKPTRHQQKKFN